MTATATQLVRAMAAHLGAVENVSVETIPWASATFSGARHIVTLDARPGASLDAFCRDIQSTEFVMPGGFVADIEIVERTAGRAKERLALAALTIDDSASSARQSV
jgi:hypothetical protein